MAYVDFKHLREAVSLEMVLGHYGIELRRVNAKSLRGKCPLPMHGSAASITSFTATVSKGLGGVWACQSQSCVAARNGKKGGNALDFVATMENCDLQTAAAKMQSWFNLINNVPVKTPRSGPTTNKPELVSKESRETGETGTEKNEPIKFTLKGIDPTHPYLKSRGVTEEMARTFGIGYFSGRGTMKDRIVFEIRNKIGELVGYAGRVIDESEPRYKFPPGFHKSLELYNLHRVIGETSRRRRVVLVEGFFPCLSVANIGFPCVALMGNTMSKEQEELIVRYFDVACIVLDSDEVGRKGSADCLARLGRRMYAYAPLLPEGMQLDTMTPEARYAVIKK